MRNSNVASTIDDSTKVGLRLVMWGAGIMLGIMSPALALAINASLKVGAFEASMKRIEKNTGDTAATLYALDKRYEGESARVDGRLSALERANADNAARLRELEKAR